MPISTVLAQGINSQTAITQLLFRAARTNDMNAVQAAIEAGADLSRFNLNGQTAIDIAISHNHFRIANYLVFARRIEQQIARKLPLTINSVQQTSPEAAPIVESARDHQSVSKKSIANNIIPTIKAKTTKKKAPNQSMLQQKKLTPQNPSSQNKNTTMNNKFETTEPLAASKTSITKNIVATNGDKKTLKRSISEPKKKPAQNSKIQVKTLTGTNKSKTVKPSPMLKTPIAAINKLYENHRERVKYQLRPSTPIFVMDSRGNLIKLTPEEVKKLQQDVKQKTEDSLPDIEPRKSLFIPKPRSKPKFHRSVVEQKIAPTKSRKVSLIGKADNLDLQNSQSKLSKYNGPKVLKLTNSPTIKKNSNKIDKIRPIRRLSPELIKKLQNGLEKTKYQKKEKSQNTVIKNIKTPIVNQSKLKSNIKLAPTPDLVNQQYRLPSPSLGLLDNKNINVSTSKGSNLFGEIYSGITNFFGVAKNERNVEKPAKNIVKVQIPDNIDQDGTPPVVSVPLMPSKKKKINLETKQIKPKNVASNNSISLNTIETNKDIIKQTGFRKYAPKIQNNNDQLKESEHTINTTTNSKRTHLKDSETDQPITFQSKISMPLTRLNKPLKNISLILGNSITTGQTKLPLGIAEPNPCIQKRRGKISFCIVPIDWPPRIENSFAINTSLYQGSRAIARYDKDKATHFHVLYTSKDHNKIIDFMKKRYGPPTDIWNRMIAPFGKPRQPNPTYVWRSLDTEINEITIIEVRKFDDTRTVFPDIEHGAIRLYTAGGPPVFPVVTAHDIMSIDWAARSDHLEDGSPVMARTIRVRP